MYAALKNLKTLHVLMMYLAIERLEAPEELYLLLKICEVLQDQPN